MTARQLQLLAGLYFVLFFNAGTLLAGHIVGGEFSYSCQGWKDGDPATGIRVYELFINMYRDAIGQGAYFDGVNGSISGRGPDGNASVGGHFSIYRGRTLYKDAVTLRLGDVAPVPIDVGNPCLVPPSNVSQQIGEYRLTIELPVSTESYTLAYQRCCRNEAISNLVSPDIIGSTYFIEITAEAQQRCNASPLFNSDPPIVVCAREEFILDLGATDREGDSLSYKLCNPVVGGGNDDLTAGRTETPFDDVAPSIESPPPYTNARWRSTFNTENQLGSTSILNIDPLTGSLSGVPNRIGIFSLAVCVEEWALDSTTNTRFLISETKREFQIAAATCANLVSADLLENSFDDQGRFYIKQCGLGEFTIINQSTELQAIESYDWKVVGISSDFQGTTRDLSLTIDQKGTYVGQMILNRRSPAANCRDTAEFILDVLPGINPEFTFTPAGCIAMPTDFLDQTSTQGSNTITGYEWDFGAGVGPRATLRNPSYTFNEGGEFPVTLVATDDNGCSDSITKPVPFFPAPAISISPPTRSFGCAPHERRFINTSTPINDNYTFIWDFGDGGMSGDRDPLYTYEEPGLYDLSLKIISPAGCTAERAFPEYVDVRIAPTANFEITPEEITNLAPNFSVLDRSLLSHNWRYTVTDEEDNVVFYGQQPDFDLRLDDITALLIEQVVSHPSGCTDTLRKSVSYSKYINTYFAPTAFTPNGDGLNDIFLPVGVLDNISEFELRVWTRYGELIFSTNSPTQGWDGHSKGTPSPGGGYLWDAQFRNLKGEVLRYKGGVSLLR